MEKSTKKVLLVGAGALTIAGILALVARKASASTPSGNPKAFGLIDAQTAINACGGAWTSDASINSVSPELFQLMTPGGNPHSGTVYGVYKNQLWRYVGQNNAGYYKCDNPDVSKLQAAGFGKAPAFSIIPRAQISSQLSPRAA